MLSRLGSWDGRNLGGCLDFVKATMVGTYRGSPLFPRLAQFSDLHRSGLVRWDERSVFPSPEACQRSFARPPGASLPFPGLFDRHSSSSWVTVSHGVCYGESINPWYPHAATSKWLLPLDRRQTQPSDTSIDRLLKPYRRRSPSGPSWEQSNRITAFRW